MRAFYAVTMAVLVAACGHNSPVPTALNYAQAVSQETEVLYRGGRYLTRVFPGQAGQQLGGFGAAPLFGQAVAVAPLKADQGKLARAVAKEACDQALGQFRPAAVGRFDRKNTWIFEGGCK